MYSHVRFSAYRLSCTCTHMLDSQHIGCTVHVLTCKVLGIQVVLYMYSHVRFSAYRLYCTCTHVLDSQNTGCTVHVLMCKILSVQVTLYMYSRVRFSVYRCSNSLSIWPNSSSNRLLKYNNVKVSLTRSHPETTSFNQSQQQFVYLVYLLMAYLHCLIPPGTISLLPYMGMYPIITARKRSLGQGNIFGNMCQQFGPQGGGWGLVPGGSAPGGGCLLWGRGCLLRGVCLLLGGLVPGRVSALGGWGMPAPGGVPAPRGWCLLWGGAWWRPPRWLLLWAVRILLECILVLREFYRIFKAQSRKFPQNYI